MHEQYFQAVMQSRRPSVGDAERRMSSVRRALT